MKNKFSVLHTPAGTSTTTDISDAIQLTESAGIRSTVDDFAFSVMGKSKYDDFFNDNDRIQIYASTDNATPSLLIDAVIKEIELSESIDRRTWSIKGQNALEVFINAPVPVAYSSTGSFNDSAKAIKNLVNTAIGKYKNARYIPRITAELKSLGGFIDDTTYTMKIFDPPGYSRTDTPAFQMIEELSTPKFTGVDPANIGNYIYFLDTSNNFHWEPRSNIVSQVNSKDIEKGDWIDIKISKTLYDTINYAIIDAGVDFNGRPIKTYYFSPTGQIKGFRAKYFVMHEIANRMKDANSISADFPYGNADTTGNTNNQTFRNRVREEAKKVGERIVLLFGSPRYMVRMTIKGTTSYSIGNLYRLNIDGVFRNATDAPVNTLTMRLRTLSHNITSKGWFIDLEFIQDEQTITGSV